VSSEAFAVWADASTEGMLVPASEQLLGWLVDSFTIGLSSSAHNL
jgi:hypothetical protein